jgi:hypothetical protein
LINKWRGIYLKKKILIESGEYPLKGTIKMSTTDVFLIGESGAVLVPDLNILAIEGVGNENILCTNCSYVLADRVVRNNILVPIKCPSCGTLNRY